MKKYLITYGDEKFRAAKERFVNAARNLDVFDDVIAYSANDVTKELAASIVFQEKRGGGLWSWKPDVILTAMSKMQDGDILVYCDAGCSLQKCKEWSRMWNILSSYDMCAQRILQRTDMWTRKSVLDFFRCANGENWERQYQFCATVVFLKVTPFTRSFVSEWRSLMIEHPELVRDVTERNGEKACFVENRHDQAVYSALVYKCLDTGRIFTMWEHIEDFDIFSKQAIRATRLRDGEDETFVTKVKLTFKRLVKDFVLKPFFYIPLQYYYQRE